MLATAETRQTNALRPWIIAAYTVGFLGFLALLAYIFTRYPNIGITADDDGDIANIPHWFGATGGSIAYLLLALFFASLYLITSIRGTYVGGIWRDGALTGAGLGLAWIVFGVLGIFVQAPVGALFGAAALVAPVVVGGLAASRTGRFASGTLAGFWVGLAAALPIALYSVATDVIFSTHFLQTSWPLDHYCNIHTGDALTACEINDDLGFASTTLVSLPLVMAGLGAVGGAIGAASARHQGDNSLIQPKGSRAPLIFSLIMASLFVAELFLRFW